MQKIASAAESGTEKERSKLLPIGLGVLGTAALGAGVGVPLLLGLRKNSGALGKVKSTAGKVKFKAGKTGPKSGKTGPKSGKTGPKSGPRGTGGTGTGGTGVYL